MTGNRDLIYSDLQLSQSLPEIRLLHLLDPPSKGKSTAEIVNTRLEIVRLESGRVPPYAALSYVWGDTTQLRDITVNGIHLGVTTNLANFLRKWQTLRATLADDFPLSSFSRAALWIDAICINQDDRREKEYQIKLMKDVYRRAGVTVIWLGEAQEDSDAALNWFHKLSQMDPSSITQMTNVEKDRLWDHRAWLGFNRLQERPYFRRRWIYQEIVLSLNPYIICGDQCLSWDQYYGAVVHRWVILINNRFDRSLEVTFTDVEPLSTIDALRHRLVQPQGSQASLFELLTKLRRAASTVLHDLVYALLGLCDEQDSRGITIDYKRPIEAVFMEVVINYIRTYGSLDILNTVHQSTNPPPRPYPYIINDVLMIPGDPNFARTTYLPALPSWTPNWASANTSWELGTGDLASNDYSPIFRACGNTAMKVLNLDRAIEEKALLALGVEVDRVTQVQILSPMTHPQQNDPNSWLFPHFWDFCRSRPISQSPYHSETERLNCYFRTLSAGGRLSGLRVIATDRYVRYHCARFFAASLASRLQSEGLLLPQDYVQPSLSECYEMTENGFPGDSEEVGYGRITFDPMCHGRLFVTAGGWIGLGPRETTPGQSICVLSGGSSPLMLKASDTIPGAWCVQGEVYMHGWMFGQAIEKMESGVLDSQVFRLV